MAVSEKRAVLSRIPVLQSVPLVNRRSTSISCPTWNGAVCRFKEQKESPFSTKGSSRATTLDSPGVSPSMVGSADVAWRMTESRIVDRLRSRSKVTKNEIYQPFIIGVPDRHTVRAASIAGEIVLIAYTLGICRVTDAHRARRELCRVKHNRVWARALADRCRVGRMALTHPKVKRRQHGDEFNGEVAAIGEVVGECGAVRSECVTGRLLHTAGLCPTLGTKQRNRQGEKREHRSTHSWIS